MKKGLPALEDMIGGFAVVITQDDGVNPFINLNMLGLTKIRLMNLVPAMLFPILLCRFL